MLAEIGARGRLHAIGVLAQIYLVQIDGEYLVLGVGFFQIIGQNGLFHLAGIAALGGQQKLLDKLLGDGAAALALPPLAKVVDGRAQNGCRVYAHVPVESIVFCSQKGHGQKARHFLETDNKAFFMVQRTQCGAVPCQNDSSLRLLVFCNAVDVGQVA